MPWLTTFFAADDPPRNWALLLLASEERVITIAKSRRSANLIDG